MPSEELICTLRILVILLIGGLSFIALYYVAPWMFEFDKIDRSGGKIARLAWNDAHVQRIKANHPPLTDTVSPPEHVPQFSFGIGRP